MSPLPARPFQTRRSPSGPRGRPVVAALSAHCSNTWSEISGIVSRIPGFPSAKLPVSTSRLRTTVLRLKLRISRRICISAGGARPGRVLFEIIVDERRRFEPARLFRVRNSAATETSCSRELELPIGSIDRFVFPLAIRRESVGFVSPGIAYYSKFQCRLSRFVPLSDFPLNFITTAVIGYRISVSS